MTQAAFAGLSIHPAEASKSDDISDEHNGAEDFRLAWLFLHINVFCLLTSRGTESRNLTLRQRGQ